MQFIQYATAEDPLWNMCHDFTDNEFQGLSIAETERENKRKTKIYQTMIL